MRQPAAETALRPLPGRRPVGSWGTGAVLCRYLKNSLHIFCTGRRHWHFSLPPSAKKVLDKPALPFWCPAPWPRRLGRARTVPAERTDSPDSVHNVYCFHQLRHPCPALAFASLMPSCCSRPLPAPPRPVLRQQLLETGSCPSRDFRQPKCGVGPASLILFRRLKLSGMEGLQCAQPSSLRPRSPSALLPFGQQILCPAY